MTTSPFKLSISRLNFAKYLALTIIVSFFSLISVSAQNITVTPTPESGTIDFGGILEISTLKITETNEADFGKSKPDYVTITISPIPGYKFDNSGIAVAFSSANDIEKDPNIDVKSENIIKVSFQTKGRESGDEITLSNLKLVPKEGVSSYGTSLGVKIDTLGTDTVYNVGDYHMVQPTLSASYANEACEGDPLAVTVNVNNTEQTLSKKDSLFFEYIKGTSDTISKGYQLGEKLIQIQHNIPELMPDYNLLKITAKFKSGWTLEKKLTIGTSSDSINRKKVNSIPFKYNDTISASVLINHLILNNYLEYATPDDWNVEFKAHQGNFVEKIGEEYRFYPDKAGEGYSKVIIVQNNINSNEYCEQIDTLYVNVYPNIITVDDIFCYGQDSEATIKVAKNALENAYKFVIGYDNPTINFNSLVVLGQGDTLRVFQNTLPPDDNGFLEFQVNPSELLDLALSGTPEKEDIDIYSIVYADVTYQSSETHTIDSVVPPLPVDYNCSYVGNGKYRCTYTYVTDVSFRLNMATELSKIAIPRNDGYIIDFKDTYCQYLDSLELKSNNPIDSITGNSIIEHKNLAKEGFNFYLKPGVFAPNVNTPDTVTLFYLDENGCTGDTTYTTTIHAVPQVEFIADTICEDVPQPFAQVSPDAGWVDIKGWSWDFGDGFTLSNFSDTSNTSVPNGTHDGNTTGTFKAPSHKYSSPGKKNVSLEIMSKQGCKNSASDTIVIGKFPSPEFTYSGKLMNSTTTLDNLTGLFPDDSVTSFIYTITAPSGSESFYELHNRNNFTFEPEEYGVYTIELSARSGNGCAGSVDTLLPVFPVKELSVDNFYFEDFTGTGLNGWLPSQTYLRNHTASWEHKAISGTFRDSKHTDGNMWLAGSPQNPIDNEISWIESPCFDLEGLRFPMVSMDVFESLESGRDGAALFYTLDDGETWHRVGSTNTGANWYNGEGIFNSPGNTIGTNEGSQGWSKDTTAWVTARHPLDTIRKASLNGGSGCVRFRIAYNSNAFHDNEYEGFAVDNFLIGKRRRIILLEEMINSAFVEADPEKKYHNVDLDALNAFVDAYPEEVCDIRYHVETKLYTDPLYEEINWWDASARSNRYGSVAFGPMWAMDGGAILSRDIEGKVRRDLTYEEAFQQRGLVDPSYEIFDVKTNWDGTSFTITSTIKKISGHFDERSGKNEMIVRYAIVQKEYKDKTGKVHRNVMIDLLPTGPKNAVAHLSPEFSVGDEETITAEWTPSENNVILDGNKYRLIIYVQGMAWYDEVQQVWFRDLDDNDIPIAVSGKNGDNARWRVYPNPVLNRANVMCPGNTHGEINWSVVSTSGQTVRNGLSRVEGGSLSIPVEGLPNGMYVLQIIEQDGTKTNKTFSKIMD